MSLHKTLPRAALAAALFLAVAPARAADDKAATDSSSKESNKGSISISSTPSGKVFIDGKDTGLSTPIVDYAVTAGSHTVKVVNGDASTSTEFTIEKGGSLNLNLNIAEAKAADKIEKKVDEKKAEAKAEEKKVEAKLDDKKAEAKAEEKKVEAKLDDKKAEAKAEEKKVEAKLDDKKADDKKAEAKADAKDSKPGDAKVEAQPWTWMSVAGWSGLGLGTIGLLSGAVVLTTPLDPDQGPLGFGLFGAGVGLVLGGGVLLYLDNELADAAAAPKAADPVKPADEKKAEPTKASTAK